MCCLLEQANVQDVVSASWLAHCQMASFVLLVFYLRMSCLQVANEVLKVTFASTTKFMFHSLCVTLKNIRIYSGLQRSCNVR